MRLRSLIPRRSQEVLRYVDAQGYRYFNCLLGRRVVGERVRDREGHLDREVTILHGWKHGYLREWTPSGVLIYEARYCRGKQHGLARQWSYKGRLLGVCRMIHGTGVDLWYTDDGRLAEERYWKSGRKHGFERWWTGDDATIYEENHFKQFEYHGIRRRWDRDGRMERGFPQFYVDGRRVNRKRYLQACARSRTLPKFDPGDDCPARPLPSKYHRRSSLGD
jgi:hypothetical protein